MSELARLISRLGTAILGVDDFPALLQESVEEIARAIPADLVAIHLEQTGSRYEYRWDRRGRVPASFALHQPGRLAEAAGRRSQILTAGGPNAQGLGEAGLRYAVLCPVQLGKDESFHLCVAFGDPGYALSGSEIDSLEGLATVLALGASRAAFQQLAVYDPWTKLYNRRWLDASLPGEVERARRYHQPLAVLAVDIDHFKQINDEHGHPTGDRVLAAIAHVLTESIRSCDAAVRTGGDEFLVVLPATSAAGAGKIANRIVERVRALSFGDAREPLRVTVSGGVAMADSASTVESLLQDADRKLYATKRGGRDGVSVPDHTPEFDDAPLLAFRDRRRSAGL